MDILLIAVDIVASSASLWALYRTLGLDLRWFDYDNIERKFVRRGA